MLELLAAESASTHDVGRLPAEGDREDVLDIIDINVQLKDIVVELMFDERYRPGELHTSMHL